MARGRRCTLPAMRTLCAVIVSCVAAAGVAAEPQALTGKVVAVADGDTLTLLDADNVQHKVRLHGIDAPERRQPFGTKAGDRLAELTKGKAATVNVIGRDKYGRTLGRIEVAGQDVNRAMVADGLAWHYVRFSDDARLAGAERDARAAQRGLWADAAPVPPWEWRTSEKARRAAKRQPAGR